MLTVLLIALVNLHVARGWDAAGRFPPECEVTLNGEPWVDADTALRVFRSYEARALIPFRSNKTPCHGFLNDATYYIRARASDREVVQTVFGGHEFKWLDALFPGDPALNILDLGGNGGYAAAYFASRYPKGHIVSVEPFLSNFGLATVNTHAYGNCVVLFGAVADKDGWFEIQKNSTEWGEWTIRVNTREDIAGLPPLHPVPGYSIPTIMNKVNWPRIDYLKVDIEGAEALLFNELSLSTGWLQKVGCVSLEYHDRYYPDCCAGPVEAALKQRNFERWFKDGELVIYCQKSSSETEALGLVKPSLRARLVYNAPNFLELLG